MQVEWYGQSAFRLTGADATVFIDPFGDTSGFAARGIEFDYPPIEGVSADIVLVTHEHRDHNGAEAIGGDPAVLRLATWPREWPLEGELVGVASEHDAEAGTQRGDSAASISAACAASIVGPPPTGRNSRSTEPSAARCSGRRAD